uniref:Suppressor of G2 allele of SKP1 n=1 Tax=Lygus hesperus TaxID=30085 RepID=A0A0K8SDD6_LYGHE
MASCDATPSHTVDTNPRFDWYQSESQVVLTVFVKNIKPETSSVVFTEDEVGVVLATESGMRVNRTFPLERTINADRSSYKIFPSKLELKLTKSDGTHWTKLEKVPEPPKPSKPSPRNWDKVVNELDDKGEESDLGQLFQKIYEEGSDEVKKAMNKSFLESGGTELNTNWRAVEKDKVAIKPPDGLEWREWDK